jgi:hypothetical protein
MKTRYLRPILFLSGTAFLFASTPSYAQQQQVSPSEKERQPLPAPIAADSQLERLAVGTVPALHAISGPTPETPVTSVRDSSRDLPIARYERAIAGVERLASAANLDRASLSLEGRDRYDFLLVTHRVRWLTTVHRVREEDLTNPNTTTSPEQLTWLSKAHVVDKSELDEFLQREFGRTLSDVYTPPQAPHFSESRSLFWHSATCRYVLRVRTIANERRNECWTNLIDIEVPTILYRGNIPCKIR